MKMTNLEIYHEWKQAKDPKKQVQIIADMEFRSKKKPVAEILIEQCEHNKDDIPLYLKAIAGLDISAELKAFAEQGITKSKIAEECGVSIPTVSDWFKKAGIEVQSIPRTAIKAISTDKPEQATKNQIMELSEIIVESFTKIGRGELFISANSDGTIFSISWNFGGSNEKT